MRVMCDTLKRDAGHRSSSHLDRRMKLWQGAERSRAYVAVTKHPCSAVTGKDGRFDLSNLPRGTYTIEDWHERFGTSTQKITVGANEAKNIDFVFKSM
jgi:carboxypeptidase family protein